MSKKVNKKEALEKISKIIKEIDEKIKKAKEIADHSGVTFSLDHLGPVYYPKVGEDSGYFEAWESSNCY